MMVMDDILVLGERPYSLHAARMVRDGQVASGAFIPLDYDKVFDFIGKEMKGKGK